MYKAVILLCFSSSLLSFSIAQSSKDEPYLGKYIGTFNSYHHQVSGEVYAVNTTTFYIKDFVYDGNGKDTFFWSGSSLRPGIQGFLVPDEFGKTNILSRYLNGAFTITLPDDKKITQTRWLAVYDLASQESFGDVDIPEGFEPPTRQRISALSKPSHGVSSTSIHVLDAKTFKIYDFNYDGSGADTFFLVGENALPHPNGTKVPDENGYLEPLRSYRNEEVILQLPGDLTVFNIKWLSIYDIESQENYGSVIIPEELNVPPSLIKIIEYKSDIPNCEQLHAKVQLRWDIFHDQVTFEIVAQVEDDEYVGFGLSGKSNSSSMDNADIAILYIKNGRIFATDYSVSGRAPCNNLLEKYRGVCKDILVGAVDNTQPFTGEKRDGITIMKFRRSLVTGDPEDGIIKKEGETYIIWAVGKRDRNDEPSFHHYYPKTNVKIEFGRKNKDNCVAFTATPVVIKDIWEPHQIFDPTIRTFTALLGPNGGKRGYEGLTNLPSPGLSWYINGYMTPVIYLRRGLTYAFKIEGGNNAHLVEYYHPFIITDEPHGGFGVVSEKDKKKYRILAGVEYTLRGHPRPSAVGKLCVWRHKPYSDRRLDDNFDNFKRYRNSLALDCQKEGQAATLEIKPNSSWPDTVYYNSYTQANMGWKMIIIDDFDPSLLITNNSQIFAPSLATILLTVLYLFWF